MRRHITAPIERLAPARRRGGRAPEVLGDGDAEGLLSGEVPVRRCAVRDGRRRADTKRPMS
jgi:hypothetical protein